MTTLIINGHYLKERGHKATLHRNIVETSKEVLLEKEHLIMQTSIEDGYDIAEEVSKWTKADFIQFHFPIYWYSLPVKTKEYITRVITGGHKKHEENCECRSFYCIHTAPAKRHCLMIKTWNTSRDAFMRPEQMVDGKSLADFVRPLNDAFHQAGIETFPCFDFFDISKKKSIRKELKTYKEYLNQIL